MGKPRSGVDAPGERGVRVIHRGLVRPGGRGSVPSGRRDAHRLHLVAAPEDLNRDALFIFSELSIARELGTPRATP